MRGSQRLGKERDEGRQATWARSVVLLCWRSVKKGVGKERALRKGLRTKSDLEPSKLTQAVVCIARSPLQILAN